MNEIPKGDPALDAALEKAKLEALERKGIDKEETRTEGQGGSFQDIASLAEEIDKAQKRPEQRNPLDLEQPLSAEQSAKMAQEFVENMDDEARTIGRFNYLKAVGDQVQLDKEGAGGLFMGNYQSEHMEVGRYSNVKFERVLRNPTDYLEAYNKSIQDFEMEIEKRKGEKKMEPSTFAQTNADERILYESDPEHPHRGIYKKIYRVKDFIPEDALAIYKRSSRGMFRDIYENHKRDILLSFEGFSRTAMERGDIEMALEGYKRLNKLNDPAVVSGVKKALEQMRQSEDPDVKRKLGDVVKKIQELSRK